MGSKIELKTEEIFPSQSCLQNVCSIPDLPEGRPGHTLSVLSSGDFVVCGGIGEEDIDPSTSTTTTPSNEGYGEGSTTITSTSTASSNEGYGEGSTDDSNEGYGEGTTTTTSTASNNEGYGEGSTEDNNEGYGEGSTEDSNEGYGDGTTTTTSTSTASSNEGYGEGSNEGSSEGPANIGYGKRIFSSRGNGQSTSNRSSNLTPNSHTINISHNSPADDRSYSRTAKVPLKTCMVLKHFGPNNSSWIRSSTYLR